MKNTGRLLLLFAALAFAPACSPADAATTIQNSPPRAGGYQVYSFLSPEVDLMTAATTPNFIPAKPGYYALWIRSKFIITKMSPVGSGWTVSPTVHMGNDAGAINMIASVAAASAGLLNASTGVPAFGVLADQAAGTQYINMTTAPSFVVGTAATGGTTLKARIMFNILYVPVGDLQ